MIPDSFSLMYPGKALLTKFFLLVQFLFPHPVFFLDYRGLPLANLVHLMHLNPVQQ
jgi:hypothetical protein